MSETDTVENDTSSFTATHTYNYGYANSTWGDLLTSYRGQTITYDANGQPLVYYNGQSYTFTWSQGRLASATKGGVTTTYTYNPDGIRTSKTVGTVTHDYILDGSRIVGETYGTVTTLYFYGADGSVLGFARRDTSESTAFEYYYYEKNLQGDVVGIFTSAGQKVIWYNYDAWGYAKGAHIAGNDKYASMWYENPFRYRGYYYDRETEFYYLQSRYYDLNTGRFISPDSLMTGTDGYLHGKNLFAYCFNNPIAFSDEAGTWPKWLTGALNVVSGVLQMAAGAAVCVAAGWTGIGAVAGAALAVNGAATVTQGVGQIVNDVTDSDVMREDNIVRTGAVELGETIGGDTGARIAGDVYDATIVVLSFSAGKVVLDKSMPKIVESKLFSANDGWGIKIGKKIEMFYRNPNASGGPGCTFFSYKGSLKKFRIDWDPNHGFHCHPPGH